MKSRERELKDNFSKIFKTAWLVAVFVVVGLFLFSGSAQAATKYIDNSSIDGGTHAVGCSTPTGTNYDPATRNCGSGSSTVYNSLKTALTSATWGDVIYMRSTGANTLDETAYINTTIAGTYSTPMTISAYNGESVTVRMSTGLAGTFLMKNATGGHIIFDGINFSNNGISNIPMVGLENAGGIVTIKNSTIDGVPYVSTLRANNITVGLYLENVIVKNVNKVYYDAGRTNSTVTLSILNSKIIKNTSQTSALETSAATPSNTINLIIRGSIFAGNKTSLQLSEDFGTLDIQGNIFTVHNGDAPAERAINFGDAAGAYFVANPTNYTIEDNVFYSFRTDSVLTSAAATKLNKMVNCDGSYIPLSNTNFFMNPGFSETDITNENFTNATFTKPALVLNGKVAFVGDSIMQGYSASDPSTTGAWNVFSTLVPGISMIDHDSAAMQAIGVEGGRWLIDKVMTEQNPSIVFLAIGLNQFYYLGGDLSTDNTLLANEIIKILQKIEDWGATPIWLGIESMNGNPPDNSNIEAVNALVEASSVTNSWNYGSILDQMEINTNWKTTYYANLISDVHPNDAGHQLIAELAEYLYYSKGIIGTNEVDIGAGARIYADGKFRNLGTANANTADLSITPQTSFNSGDKSYWMDVSAITWFDTGTHHKIWTESSTVAGLTNTVHTVGDLEANTYYNVKVDDVLGQNISCTAGVCLSNAQGEITFTYTGTYSEHTFDVEEKDVTAPTGFSLSLGITTISSIIASIADAIDDISGLHATTPYYFDRDAGTATSDWQAGTTWTDSSLTSNTQYTYKVKARDAASTPNVSSFTATQSKYTLAPTPTNLAADTVGQTSITITVDAINNPTADSSGYYFANTTNSTNSGWIQTDSWQDTSLTCGTTYNYTVKYRNGDGTETDTASLTQATSACDDDAEDLDISDIDYESTETTITVKWKTNNKADSKVEYGTAIDMDQDKEDDDNEKSHKIVLKDLDPDTLYYFKIKSEDENGSEDSSDRKSIRTKEEDAVSSFVNNLFSPTDSKEENKEENSENKSEEGTDIIDKVNEIPEKIQEKLDETKFFNANIFQKNAKKYLSEVKFQLVDKLGNPIANTLVTLHSDPQTTTTDEQGYATFKDVETGKHNLVFNYQNDNRRFAVNIQEPKTENGAVQMETVVIQVGEGQSSWIYYLAGILAIIIVFLIFKRKKKKSGE